MTLLLRAHGGRKIKYVYIKIQMKQSIERIENKQKKYKTEKEKKKISRKKIPTNEVNIKTNR